MFRQAALVALLTLPVAARAQQPNPSFNLVNRAAQPIMELYATPAGLDRWGRDRLTTFLLPPGQTFPVRLPADGNCVYDIRVVYADGSPEERRRLDTCQLDQVAFPAGRAAAATPSRPTAGDPTFRLVNRSRSEVNEVYASPPAQGSWGEDRLGDDTVAPNGAAVVRLERGECTYDVRVVFANGQVIERRALNLCTLTDLRVP